MGRLIRHASPLARPLPDKLRSPCGRAEQSMQTAGGLEPPSLGKPDRGQAARKTGRMARICRKDGGQLWLRGCSAGSAISPADATTSSCGGALRGRLKRATQQLGGAQTRAYGSSSRREAVPQATRAPAGYATSGSKSRAGAGLV